MLDFIHLKHLNLLLYIGAGKATGRNNFEPEKVLFIHKMLRVRNEQTCFRYMQEFKPIK
jgi:hypothetical protein